MSTKIYTGFKLETTDLNEVKRLVEAFRPWIEEQQFKVFDAFAAFENKLRDPPRELGHPQYWQDIFWPWHEQRKEIKKTGYRNPMVDTDFEICIFPTQERFFGTRFYGMAFTERYEWYEEWIKQPGVSEYRYWNNTDQPDCISDEEWEERSRMWKDVLLPGPGVPSLNGFTMAVGDPNGPNLYKHPAYQKAREDSDT